MQRLILEKKGLRKDVLERQREPLLRLRQEARTKNRKIREILNLQDKIFEEAVVFLFPEQERKEALLLPPLFPTPSLIERPIEDELVKVRIEQKGMSRKSINFTKNFRQIIAIKR